MSFWDNVKKFTQPYADDDYDEYEDDEEVVDDYDEEPESTSRYSRRGSASETADREDTGFGFDTGSSFAAPAATSASTGCATARLWTSPARTCHRRPPWRMSLASPRATLRPAR